MKYIASAIILISITFLWGCDEQKIYESNLDAQQVIAKNLSGTWESPVEVKTPENVPKSIISKLRLVFTVDENGLPDKFFSEGAQDVFNVGSGTWNFREDDLTKIVLEGIKPIMDFNIDTSVTNRLRLWFTTTWRDTNGNSGEGLFEVTMKRSGT